MRSAAFESNGIFLVTFLNFAIYIFSILAALMWGWLIIFPSTSVDGDLDFVILRQIESILSKAYCIPSPFISSGLFKECNIESKYTDWLLQEVFICSIRWETSLVRVLLAWTSVGPSRHISLIVVWRVVRNSSLIVGLESSLLSTDCCPVMSYITLTVVNNTTMNSFTKLQLTSGRSSSLVSAFRIDSLSFWGSSAWSWPSKYLIKLLVSNYTLARMPNYACDYELLVSFLSTLISILLESISVFYALN